MRLPNGFGSVYKLSGNRRNPFVAMKTVGWDEEGRQVRQPIGYYKTRAAAMQALAEYNSSPYDVVAASITFAELFEMFSAKKFEKISRGNVNGYKASFKAAAALHEMKMSEIKAAHLQDVIDSCKKGHGSRKKIKVLFNQIYKFGLENDILQKDYSKFVEVGQNTDESSRRPFSASEIQLLWENLTRFDFVDSVLISIYTGLRPGELVTIKTADVDLKERVMRGGIKTAAGKNRVIPINKKILPLVAARVNEGHEFLFANDKGGPMSYFTYYDCHFMRIMDQLGLSHKPHDTRHTFATLMDNAGANKLSIKRIMGHASKDITDKVYTHKDISELKKAVDLLVL